MAVKNCISKETLIDLYNQKLEIKQIASILKVTTVTICNYLEKYQLRLRTKRQRHNRPSKKNLEFLYNDMNKSVRDIAGNFKVSREVIRYWFRVLEIKPKPVGRYRSEAQKDA